MKRELTERRRMAGVDRISALPEELKVSVLSRLSITDAVRTSVLSRSWRHLWSLLPGLCVDEDFFDDLNLSFPDLDIGEDVINQTPDILDKMSRCIGIVERLLSSLRGPVRFFSLFPLICTYETRQLDRFLDLIRSHGNSIPAPCLQLPYIRSLKQLHLNWVHLSLPPDFQGFDQLTFLYLDRVWISQHDINALINQSKKLISFVARYLYRTDDEEESLLVTFNCPVLKFIVLEFEMPLAQARVVSAPCLERVCLTAALWRAEELASVWLAAAIMKLMADVAHVPQLSLDTAVLKCLSQVNVPHTLRVHFKQLRCLKLVGDFMDRWVYETFCRLLRSMPCLEFLQIECDDPVEHDELVDPIPPSEYRKKQVGFQCLDQTLRRVAVSIVKLNSIKNIMWMMYFMLLNTNVLENIEITFAESDPQVTANIIEELRAVEKASLDAKVVLQHN